MEQAKMIADETVEVRLSQIRRDGGTQAREGTNWKHVELLREQLDEGMRLEPIVVFFDGDAYWLADGFHRWYAHRNYGSATVQCQIRFGSRRDAVLYAVGANADHRPALPRTRQDKRRSASMLLLDSEWCCWSDSEIARRCRVSQPFVSKLRSSLQKEESIESIDTRFYTNRHGRTARMKTGNIGKVSSDKSTDRTEDTGARESLIFRLQNILIQAEKMGSAPSKESIFDLVDMFPAEIGSVSDAQAPA